MRPLFMLLHNDVAGEQALLEKPTLLSLFRVPTSFPSPQTFISSGSSLTSHSRQVQIATGMLPGGYVCFSPKEPESLMKPSCQPVPWLAIDMYVGWGNPAVPLKMRPMSSSLRWGEMYMYARPKACFCSAVGAAFVMM